MSTPTSAMSCRRKRRQSQTNESCILGRPCLSLDTRKSPMYNAVSMDRFGQSTYHHACLDQHTLSRLSQFTQAFRPEENGAAIDTPSIVSFGTAIVSPTL